MRGAPFLVTGDAVKVARLHAGAEPDEVVAGALTERLTRDAIEYQARDSIVAARIDGLPPTEKITFQRASVIGDHFALDELLALDGEMGKPGEASAN